MKKNISINISGIIFHIEEDGYESLRKYLDSVNKYFASFEDSSEILADIESRIAEIFLGRLNDGKQVITSEDVSALIATMGSVSDFKAAEEQEIPSGEKASSQQQPHSTFRQGESRRLYRDQNRKILGGVCAGIGHYFNVDPVWPRLLLALLTVGTSGIFLIFYIILWIVLPAANLEEETSIKKMYRDGEKRVLGGVAAGVAAFFGSDIALIRLLFVITAFFGFGMVTYIVLWIVLPEAKTITEKMKMQGEPVTLSNIESSVKKSMNEKEATEEGILTKIILFPFRAIGAVLQLLGPLFAAILNVLRIAIGIVITLMGMLFIFAFLMAFGVLIGFLPPNWHLFSDLYVTAPNIPFNEIRNSFPVWLVVVAFFTVLIPSLFAMLIGSSIIARRIVFSATVGWSLFVVFFLGIALMGFTLPQLIFGFKEEGEYKTEQTIEMGGKIPVLQIHETGMDDYDVTTLYLRGYEGKNIKLIKRFESQGSSRKVASENAQMVDYQVTQTDSLLAFDSNITFRENAKFRAQRLDVDVLIPYGQTFVVEAGLWRLIDSNEQYRILHNRETHTLQITVDGWECLTCHNETDPQLVVADEFGLRDFNSIDMQGLFNARIEKGDSFAVEVRGPESEKRRYDVYVNGRTLVIDYKEKSKSYWKKDFLADREMKIRITMPALRELDVTGAGNLRFRGFNEEEVDLKLTGAVIADGELDADRINVELSGVSFLDLKGKGRFMDADITGASGLRAYGYDVGHCVIDVHGASSAKVNVSETLEINKGMASRVSHRGNAEVIRR